MNKSTISTRETISRTNTFWYQMDVKNTTIVMVRVSVSRVEMIDLFMFLDISLCRKVGRDPQENVSQKNPDGD